MTDATTYPKSIPVFLTDGPNGQASGVGSVQLLDDTDVTGPVVGPLAGGWYIVTVMGTFGGTTAALSYLGPDGSTYIAAVDGSFTAAGSARVLVGAGCMAKMTLTGGSPSGMSANLAAAA